MQPLVLTWSYGDSQAERFEVAKAYCQVCLKKRRSPDKMAQGFQKALARLPLVVLRILAAGVRGVPQAKLGAYWFSEG